MTTQVMLQPQVQNSGLCSKEEQKSLAPELIRSLLDVSPEMQQIEDLVDRRCSALHQDERLGDFSALFQQVINHNKELFSSQTPAEQAGLLYQFHSDAIVNPIVSDHIPTIAESFMQKLGPSFSDNVQIRATVREAFQNVLYSRVNYAHADYISIAAAKALKISVKELPHLSFPSTSTKMETSSLDLGLYRNP